MKNLIKVLLILFVALFSYQTNAQTFGIKGGLNLANMLEKDDHETYSTDYRMNPGFHLGLTVEVPFNEFLSFEPGLLLTTKGVKHEFVDLGTEVMVEGNLYYLDVPLTIKASFDLGGLKMFGAIGPYVGLGLSGQRIFTVEQQGDEISTEEDIKWGNDADEHDFRRLDTGLTFGGGVEINPILIGISYDLGLSNISAYQEGGFTVKNRVLKFSVGFRF